MQYPASLDVPLISIKSSFQFEGLDCAATLHLPPDATGPLPAVLMVHGWGGGQEVLTPVYCQHFVAAGFAVMEFDYPSWGSSAGWPRQDINPWRRVRAASAALAHLRQLQQVDRHRVILWGSSFGGGHVVELVAEHPELYGAMIQVPMLDGMLAVRAVPLLRLVRFMLLGLWDWLKPGRAVHIPTVSRPGEFGSMDRDEAFHALELAVQATGWRYDNRVTARSALMIALYRPLRRLRDVHVPMLVIGADNDSVAPFAGRALRDSGNPNLRVHNFPGHHFSPYFEPMFSDVIRLQLDFLRELATLPPRKLR